MYYTGSNAFATLRQGLVGAWCPSLPNGGSGNTLPDQSGYGNHGSLVNMSPDDWVSGQYGRALDFDGSNDYLDTTTVQPTEQYTVTGFAAVDSFSNSPLIYTFRDPLNAVWDTGFLETNNTGSQLFYGVRDINIPQTTFRTYTLSQSLVAGQFFHFATVKFAGSDTGELYVNGIRQTSFTGSLNAVPGRGTLRFAAYTPPSFYMDGRLDDLRLYNRALSEPEIRLLASRPGIGLRQESHRNTFYQFPSFQPALARRSSAIIGGGIT